MDRRGQTSANDLLVEARREIVRLTPAEALEKQLGGALLIDIRSDGAREREGILPGSVHVPRTVLEWRADPTSPWRSPGVTAHDGPLILLCDQGWSSSLAAFTLLRLGHDGIGDVIGGFEAWEAAGLPVVPAPQRPASSELPGIGPPDGEPEARATTVARHRSS